MAKKRRKPIAEDGWDDGPGSVADSLGKLMSAYHVNVAGVLILSAAGALVGLGLLGYGVTRQPTSLTWVGIGTLLLLGVVVMAGTSAFNIGRRFEVRKRGIRFIEAGVETVMLWENIADIEIDRRVRTKMGPVTVFQRGSHYATPSGPLTHTEWGVTIHARDGQTIYLRPMFLKLVPDVRKLISQLRMRAGI
jgi:hypothetical protein